MGHTRLGFVQHDLKASQRHDNAYKGARHDDAQRGKHLIDDDDVVKEKQTHPKKWSPEWADEPGKAFVPRQSATERTIFF